MFERLRRLYAAGRLDETGLTAAVARGWITQDEADQILSEVEP